MRACGWEKEVGKKKIFKKKNLRIVPGAFDESPPLQDPILICMGDWGYWLAEAAGSRVLTVAPSICQVI